jgi:FkbM family methyltransferase
MPGNCNNLLYKKTSKKGFTPAHVAEVGVWHPDTSNIYQYIQAGIKTTLIEPDPESIKLIKAEFANKANVLLHEVALCDFNGQVELCKRQSSTFVSTLSSSPALVNDNCDLQTSDKFSVEARIFSEIDDGSIDLISIDTEGSEWFVIKNMKSRPNIISIETHGGMYTNPYLHELLNWMQKNNYRLWYKDKSDSVFVKNDSVSIEFPDTINLMLMNLKIAFASRKKRLSKKIKALRTS